MLEKRLRIEDRGRELLVDAEAVEGRRRADLAALDVRRLDPAEEPEPGKGGERGGELRRGDGPERRPGRVPSMGPEKVFFFMNRVRRFGNYCQIFGWNAWRTTNRQN